MNKIELLQQLQDIVVAPVVQAMSMDEYARAVADECRAQGKPLPSPADISRMKDAGVLPYDAVRK